MSYKPLVPILVQVQNFDELELESLVTIMVSIPISKI